MPTLWFISCDLCYNLHTLFIQVLFRPFSTMAVNILVNFDLRSCFSRFACPNSFNSYMWEFILHGPSIGTAWCRVMLILRAQLLVTSSAECHSSSVMYWRSSIPTFTSSQCSSSHHPRATSIMFSYHFSISIAMIILYQIDLFLLVSFFQHLSIEEVFSVYSRATFLPLLREWGLYCSTSNPHRTINLLLILQLGFASRSHLMLSVGMKTHWSFRISPFKLVPISSGRVVLFYMRCID